MDFSLHRERDLDTHTHTHTHTHTLVWMSVCDCYIVHSCSLSLTEIHAPCIERERDTHTHKHWSSKNNVSSRYSSNIQLQYYDPQTTQCDSSGLPWTMTQPANPNVVGHWKQQMLYANTWTSKNTVSNTWTVNSTLNVVGRIQHNAIVFGSRKVTQKAR
jgi:hypothetical protein